MYARDRWNAHMQIVGGDLFHAGVHRPGALLELQLPIFNFKLPCLILLLLQFDEQLSRLVLRRDQRQRANHQNARQHRI